ncbi:hypothetical protein [Streptomyces sp. 11x1]|uniref:hypothetical protein n=1 Tax=Streptomyces sp. 11x1 TaxID=3038642 RepID=UPI00292FE948|nr:hypothetical protein [Streptomyces sp. 11x1]WNZ09431.1 hypothetical protein P8T65_18800 [Streptomyces sp. 11x1]
MTDNGTTPDTRTSAMPLPPTPPEGEPGSRTASRGRASWLVPALLGVVATVGAAVITVLFGNATNTFTVQVEAGDAKPGATVTVTASPSGQQQGPGGEPSAQNATSEVRREQNGVPLNTNYSIDLDSHADNWGVRQNQAAGNDLWLYSGLRNRQIAVVTGQTPDPGTCDRQTAFSQLVDADQLSDGLELCVQTSEKRWSWVTVSDVINGGASVTLDIRVWN